MTGAQSRRSSSSICLILHSITSTNMHIVCFYQSRVISYTRTVALVTQEFCSISPYLYFGPLRGSAENSG